MRVVLRLLIVVPTVVLVVLTADAALAESRTSDAYIDATTGNPTAESRHSAAVPRRRGGGRVASNCQWRIVNANDGEVAMYDVDGTRLISETGRWLSRWCNGEPVMVNDAYAVPQRPPAPPAVLAQEARQSVGIPDPPLVTSPPLDRGLVVRMPTWLWLEPGWWRPYSATAEAGGVTTTVVAEPVRAVWSTGDGETVCGGPGIPWRRGLPDDATSCSFVYTNSSAGQPGGTFTLSVTVTFEVSWSSNLGTGGELAPVTRTASRAVRVGEIQAIETG